MLRARRTARSCLLGGFALLIAGSVAYFAWFLHVASGTTAPLRAVATYGVQLSLVPLGYLAAAMGWWLLSTYAASTGASLRVVRRGLRCFAIQMFAIMGAEFAALLLTFEGGPYHHQTVDVVPLALQVLGGAIAGIGFLMLARSFTAVGEVRTPARPHEAAPTLEPAAV